MTNEKEPKLIVTEEIAEKFFEKYCHNNDSMVIIELDGERFAYDGTFDNGYGKDEGATGRGVMRGDVLCGDAKALALKIGSEIEEEYFVRKYHIIAPGRALSTEVVEESNASDNPEDWSDFFDVDDLYLKCEDNHYEQIDLKKYVDKEFIKKLGNRENRENTIVREAFKKDVAKMILETNGDNDLFFEEYQNKYKYGVVDMQEKENFKKSYNLFKEDIEKQDYFSAYMEMKNSASSIFRDSLKNLDFLKAIAKEEAKKLYDGCAFRDAADVVVKCEYLTRKEKWELVRNAERSKEYRDAVWEFHHLALSPFKESLYGSPSIWRIPSCFGNDEKTRKEGLKNNLWNLEYQPNRDYLGISTPEDLAEAKTYFERLWSKPYLPSEPDYTPPWKSNEEIDRELFIKAVVKKHGTDFEAIQKTVDDVVDKAENLNLGLFNNKAEFKAKLLQELLNSDEYKKIEKEQGQRKVEGVDCVKQANAKTFEQDFLELCKSHNVSPKKAIKSMRVKQANAKAFKQDFSELCKEHNVSPKKAIKAMLNKMVDEKNKQNKVQR